MDTPTSNYFGLSIRFLREQKGLVQRELAKEAKTSQSAIARIEKGLIDPRISTVQRICEVLGSTLIFAPAIEVLFDDESETFEMEYQLEDECSEPA